MACRALWEGGFPAISNLSKPLRDALAGGVERRGAFLPPTTWLRERQSPTNIGAWCLLGWYKGCLCHLRSRRIMSFRSVTIGKRWIT